MEERNVELKRMFIGSIFPSKLIYLNGKVEPLEIATTYRVLKAMAASPNSLSAEDNFCFEPLIVHFTKLM